jgi:hypothetical protein
MTDIRMGNPEYLILSPPVLTPSEPPSGPFLLTAGLRARGMDAAFMDLSLMFFMKVFEGVKEERGMPPVRTALDFFRNSIRYEPQRHRTYSGILNSALQRYSSGFPGWRITLMDAEPPCDKHSPSALKEYFGSGAETPFSGFWDYALDGIIKEYRPGRILISISYLSQLPAAVDLHEFLESRGLEPLTGGSLPRSLVHSGDGFDLLEDVFGRLITCDGSSLTDDGKPLLSSLSWPRMISDWDYLAARPVIPFALSTGCYWDRCLFCPDRGWDFNRTPLESLSGFCDGIPSSLPGGRPLIHFLDSASPPAALAQALPVIRSLNASFYGFVRPSEDLLGSGILPELAEDGCLMLQLGVESGSRDLLDRFDKGLDPGTSLEVLEQVTETGIRTYVYLLLGLPGESVADQMMTAALIERAGDTIDYLNISVFNLPRSSELIVRADEFGMSVTDFNAPQHAIRLYSPFTCEGVSPRDSARKFIREDLSGRQHVMRSLKNTPKWFRGPHMAMMDLPGRRDPTG